MINCRFLSINTSCVKLFLLIPPLIYMTFVKNNMGWNDIRSESDFFKGED